MTSNLAALTAPAERAASPAPLTVTWLSGSMATVLAPVLPGLITAPKSRTWVACRVTGARIVTLTLAEAETLPPAWAPVAERAVARAIEASRRAFCTFMLKSIETESLEVVLDLRTTAVQF